MNNFSEFLKANKPKIQYLPLCVVDFKMQNKGLSWNRYAVDGAGLGRKVSGFTPDLYRKHGQTCIVVHWHKWSIGDGPWLSELDRSYLKYEDYHRSLIFTPTIAGSGGIEVAEDALECLGLDCEYVLMPEKVAVIGNWLYAGESGPAKKRYMFVSEAERFIATHPLAIETL